MNTSESIIGLECYEARKLKGVTLRKLQELTGIDKSKLSRFEHGKFDERVFLYYYPFWTEFNKYYSSKRIPAREMKKISDYENYFLKWPQYCLYDTEKETKFENANGRACFGEYWKLRDHISRMSDLIKNNKFKRD